MAGEWRDCLIGDVAEVIGGSTPSTKNPANFDGDVPWLTPKDLSGPHDRYVTRGERNLTRQGLANCSAQLVPAGTVLLSSRAPIGYVAIAKNPIATNQGFRNLISKPGNVPEFIYYWLTANVPELERHASGSTFKEISGTTLKGIPIRVPSEAEQRAIAHILGTLDDKIELNRRMNETLEAMARSIFKSWFVDFDPVRAKTEGGDPGLPKRIADLFPDSFEDSELGKIPVGWWVRPFTEMVEIIGGGTPKTAVAEYWGGIIPWFSVVDAPAESDIYVIETKKYITQEGLDNSAACLLPEGTTIISARGTVGKLALADMPMTMNQSCYGLRGIETGPAFTYFATRNLVIMLKQCSHGSVFDTITRDTLGGVSFVAPPKAVIETFERVADPLMQRIKSNLHESRIIADLRDTQLPKLISGELRVRSTTQIIESTEK